MNYHILMLENQTIYSKLAFAQLSKYNLSMGQPKVLEYLLSNNGCIQKQIAENCQIESASATVLLSKMEKDGLIERKSLNNNRRCLHVYLTDIGRERALYTKQILNNLDQYALDGLSEDEKKTLLELLDKVNKNLKK